MNREECRHPAGPNTDESTVDVIECDDESPTYDPTADSYTSTFSTTETSASVAVMDAMVDIRRCSTTDIDPLYDTIDTDSLDTLVRSAGPSVTVRFSIDGFRVVVTGRGRIEVTPPESA